MNEEANLLERVQLTNKLEVSLYDHSRKVAGDRWLVKVKCVASAELPQDFFSKKFDEENDPELVDEIKDRFGKNLLFEINRELNFVDENEKDESIVFLIGSLKENMIDYMGRKSFIDKLLLKKYNEYRQEVLTRKNFEFTDQNEKEDEGPADFSSCFRD